MEKIVLSWNLIILEHVMSELKCKIFPSHIGVRQCGLDYYSAVYYKGFFYPSELIVLIVLKFIFKDQLLHW